MNTQEQEALSIDESNIGVTFVYTDGVEQSFDPVNEKDFDDNQTDEAYIFEEFVIPKSEVVSFVKYNLCAGCGRSIKMIEKYGRHFKPCLNGE
jgi:hypothetical protein